MVEMPSWDIDRLIKLINQRGIMSPSMLSRLLVFYAKNDPVTLDKLLTSIRPSVLCEVHSVLDACPHTDVGWSVLPRNREAHIIENLSDQEQADIENQLFQEDREFVEFVRNWIRKAESERKR